MPGRTNNAAIETEAHPGLGISELLGGFIVIEQVYPSGKKYLAVYRGKQRVGCCEKVEGGYLVWHKRKPVESIVLAIKQMIDDGMNVCRAEEAKWRKMMQFLRTECGPLLTETQRRKQQAGNESGIE